MKSNAKTNFSTQGKRGSIPHRDAGSNSERYIDICNGLQTRRSRGKAGVNSLREAGKFETESLPDKIKINL
jgi:hypothetical protein